MLSNSTLGGPHGASRCVLVVRIGFRPGLAAGAPKKTSKPAILLGNAAENEWMNKTLPALAPLDLTVLRAVRPLPALAVPLLGDHVPARGHTDIPAWLGNPHLASITNITQGILGYKVTQHLLKNGKFLAAKLQPVWSHAAMLFILVVGWDGRGLQALLLRRHRRRAARRGISVDRFFAAPRFLRCSVWVSF